MFTEEGKYITQHYYYYYYYYYYLLQLSCHSVAVVLTLVQTNQIRINIHKRNNTKKKHSTNNTKHSKYDYTRAYCQNTHIWKWSFVSKLQKEKDINCNQVITIEPENK